MSIKPYPKYKDSGVEWLARVPEHWEIKRLKQTCKVFPSNVDKKSYDGEAAIRLCNYVDVYKNEIITGDLQFMAATATDEQITKFTLRAGDVIITKDSETADDIAIAAYVPVDLPGVVCGYHLAMVRPFSDTRGAFVKRLFDSVYAKSCFAVLANGLTRVGLGQYELDNVELPFPPSEEQSSIASFIDHETGKIDSLIKEQEGLIDLLKEKRSAVISHAVTKGLDQNVKMKDSGVEWLGLVPEHWEVKRLRFISSKIGSGKTPSGGAETYVDEGVLFIRSQNVYDEGLFLDDSTFITPEIDEKMSDSRVMEGDILLNITGASLGRTCLVPSGFKSGNVNQHVCIVRLAAPSLRDFVSIAMKSGPLKAQYDAIQNGAAREGLNFDQVGRLRLPIPSNDERTKICSYVFKATAKFESLINESESAINLLQERRSALISAAVTGQIDVRR